MNKCSWDSVVLLALFWMAVAGGCIQAVAQTSPGGAGWLVALAPEAGTQRLLAAGQSDVGSLVINLAPPEAVAAGAQWRRVGTTVWRDSGNAETDLSAGHYAVEFKAADGWAPPPSRSVTLGAGQTTTLTLEYSAVQSGVAWSSYLGQDVEFAQMGAGSAQKAAGTRTAVDKNGNILVIGTTSAGGWVSGGYDTDFAGATDAFVAKLSPLGEHLWSAYLGAGGIDHGLGVSTDAQGNVYAVGDTASPGWVSGGFASTYLGGASDGFMVKLSPQGAHLMSTYIGGDNYDSCHGVAVNSSGYVFITGITSSAGWTLYGGDTSFNGDCDAFVIEITPDGSHGWSTYIGGSLSDVGSDICLDSSGQCCIAGATFSSSWTYGGYDTSYNGGGDGFLIKLNTSGYRIWSAYLGGSGADWANSVAIDGTGNLYVAGETDSSGWISGGFDTTYHGATDGFVTKVNSSGQRVWSAYLGGDNADRAQGLALDINGNVCVCGSTRSPDWMRGGHQVTLANNSQDAFLAQLSPSGQRLWSTYLGGDTTETAHDLAIDNSNNIIMTGLSASPDWVAGGFDASFNGAGYNAYVAKLHGFTSLRVDLSPDAAVAQGAQWRRLGTQTWRNSREAEHLPAGSYSIEFKRIENWTTPAQATVTVKSGQASVGSGSYVIVPGMLSVTITPPEAVAHGAKWRRVGTTVWRDSQTTETNLADGTYSVEFSNIDLTGWIRPSPVSGQVAGGVKTGLNAVYGVQPVTVKLDTGAPNHTTTTFSVGIRFSRPVMGLTTSSLVTTNSTPSNLRRLTVQRSLACGDSHSLAIGADGQLVAWGLNSNSQAAIPSGLGPVAAVAALNNYNLVLKTDGTLQIFGNDTYGPKSSSIPAGLTGLVGIAAGFYHCLVLRADGTVAAFGEGYVGQCNIPANLSRVVAIAAGGFHNLALRADGVVVAWGDNYGGQCNVPPGLEAVAVAAGSSHSLALRADGTVAAWGNNYYGQCNVPAGLSNVVAIAAGPYHNLALRADGMVVSWGDDSNGRYNVPANLNRVVAIAVGEGHSLAMRDDGSIVGWGNNSSGQCNAPANFVGRLPAMTLGRFDVTPHADAPLAVQAPAGAASSLGGAPTQPSNLLALNTDPPGKLKVSILPDEASALGARWRLAGSSAWLSSGATATDVVPGEATIEFRDVSGWTSPAAQTVTIGSNQLTSASGAYVCVSGALGVTLVPDDAITSGAQWRRVGTTEWRDSGTTETVIPMGPCEIEFKNAPGWSTPVNQRVTIPAHDVCRVAAQYTLLTTGMTWSTYLGGAGDDYCYGAAFDKAGNLVVGGMTTSVGWTSGGIDTTQNGGQDVFAAKFTPAGRLLWSTYLGGVSDDRLGVVTVDRDNNIYVAGCTYSHDWVSGGFRTGFQGNYENTEAFLVKLTPSGQHLWSTYIGGTAWDYASEAAVDSHNNVYVVGTTSSVGWTLNGYDTTHNTGYEDGYVIKISPQGQHLWSSYIGGSSHDSANGVAVDGSDNVIVTGSIQAYGLFEGTPPPDIYVAKFSPTGARLWYDEEGGSGYECGLGAACDAAGNVFVTGSTSSAGWVAGGYNTTYQSSGGFLIKYSPQGARLWSTYLGGAGSDGASAIAMDAAGNAYVTGSTSSDGWFSGGLNTVARKGSYLLKLTNDGQPVWGTYIGGDSCWSNAVTVDAWGNVAVAGYTSSSGWTQGGHDTQLDGGDEGFALRIHAVGAVKVTLSPADAVMAGAAWRWVGASDWLADGATSPLPPGTRQIEFKSIPGWVTPPILDVTIVQDQVKPVSASYTLVPTGALQITLSPSTVTTGAWRRVGTSIWRASGETESFLPVGSCSIEFKPVDNWVTPGAITVQIAQDQTLQVSRSYRNPRSAIGSELWTAYP